MRNELFESLTPRIMFILLALAVKERHGYEIMKQVKIESNGKVNMGPATLYGAIKKLLADKWIKETEVKEVTNKQDERRRYYTLTELGRNNLLIELHRYEETLVKAKQYKVLLHLIPEIQLT